MSPRKRWEPDVPWAVAAAAVGAAGTMAASSSASRGQQNAADAAAAEQARQYDLARSDQAPWRQAGANALANLTNLSGQFGKVPTAAEVMGQPGYQFGLDQGVNALEGRAAAQGGLYSGATGKALTRYANDYATTKFADAFNQKRLAEGDIWNRYAGLAGIGQTATNQLNALGQNYANAVGNIGMSNANAQGAAQIAQGNALQGALNQGVSWWNNRQQPPMGGYTGGGASNGMGGWGSSVGYGTGQTYDPSTGATLFRDGGPVRKFAWGGAVRWGGPEAAEPVQGMVNPPAAMPGVAPEMPVEGMQAFSQPGQAMQVPPDVYSQPAEAMQMPMQIAPPPGKALEQPMSQTQPTQQPQGPTGPYFDNNTEQTGLSYDDWASLMKSRGYADGGRVEPKIGTKGPMRGETGGGLSRNALLLLLQQQQMQQMQQLQQMQQPIVGSIDPRIALQNRLRAVGEYSVGGQVEGPGGPRDDAIPARLSNGEHVIAAHEVDALGGGDNARGQMKLNRLRAMLRGQ